MKIICIGRNYIDHAKELNNPVPKSPLIFMKPSTALLKDGKPFYHPDFSKNIHYELEVVLKICKNGKAIPEKYAKDYFEEIGLGIDLTARDIQDICKEKGNPWELAKAFDHSAVLGSFVNKKKIESEEIKFKLLKNGLVVQNGNTKDLIFKFEYLISYISKYFTLQKGDLIFTGTPAGVGKINIEDHYEGWIENTKYLDCRIK
ncbi:MAG: fumarylacetoacetate hydrolase family protein [Saprospiraceae bacterium]|nr:fumarylacetoacetate hydrolase family protein [Saprospiraceae bacterium]MBL0027132.1 fumarylacetoacetate hydrolase family protein [Saprospiraceae bacterium]